jgi:tRNA(fMet)-specific endonuclease VapC
MKYMLDTNICVYIARRKPLGVLRRLQRTDVADVCVSAITVAELQYGVHKSARPQGNRLALAEFLASLEIASFGEAAAARYGEVRADLERRGTPIGPLDMLIAAHALSLDLTVVTNNDREFRRVPGLRTDNWV